MEVYKKGKVVLVGKNYIVFESNNCGEIIYVSNIQDFKLNAELKLFIYRLINEYINSLYGFLSFQERILFEDLININGVGPKTALSLLKEGKDYLINIIANEDLESLNSFPYIGRKTASQLLFELSEKYKKFQNQKNDKNKVQPSMLKETLKNLGFNKKQINYAIKNVKPHENIENLVEESIKLISNAKFS